MIELINNDLNITFPEHKAQLHKRICAWIDEKLAGATSQEKTMLPASRGDLFAKFRSCFPEVRATISFHRTLRIPDDGRDYPLPPGLGKFPVLHTDDFAEVPETWKKRGGVMLPMHRGEALYLGFNADFPMAIKVGAGGICAISGEKWTSTINATPQNYVVLPYQQWLDGFRVSEEIIRQFVAVPMGKGMTVEHQLTGEETWGGLQLQAMPLGLDYYWLSELRQNLEERWWQLVNPPQRSGAARAAVASIGFGAGGRMKQEIFDDMYRFDAWESLQTSRCFVHLCIADDWQRLTGSQPPQKPLTAQDYTKAGLPWFDYETGQPALTGETILTTIKSVGTLIAEKTGLEMAENSTVTPTNIVKLKPRTTGVVREF